MLLTELYEPTKFRTLYVCRNLTNYEDILSWAKSQGLSSILPNGKLHVTIAYSKEKVDWSKTKPDQKPIVVDGGLRKVMYLGKPESPALVLSFESNVLWDRWEDFIENVECSWSHDTFRPHLSLSYAKSRIDIKNIKPYTGKLIFGPERFKELDTNWNDEIKEDVLNEDKEMRYSEIVNEGFRLDHENIDHVYNIFKKSYEEQTGVSWSREKFLSRAKGWEFFGDQNGFVAIRKQYSGPKKLVGAAGDPRSVLKGLSELQAEGGPIWGAVSEPLARAAKKRGLIVPSFFPGGGLLIKTLISTIPDSVFGGMKPTVNNDGSLTMDYEDTGTATKYLIGNKEYFAHAMKLPEIAEKLKTIPGVTMLLKMMGV